MPNQLLSSGALPEKGVFSLHPYAESSLPRARKKELACRFVSSLFDLKNDNGKTVNLRISSADAFSERAFLNAMFKENGVELLFEAKVGISEGEYVFFTPKSTSPIWIDLTAILINIGNVREIIQQFIGDLNEEFDLELSADEISKRSVHLVDVIQKSGKWRITSHEAASPAPDSDWARRINAERGQELPPMPTHEELERDGKLYSQVYRTYDVPRSEAIIAHLKAVWMPWIEAGVEAGVLLTRPELLNRDKSAYKALSKWLKSNENLLEVALGHAIPSKTEEIDRLVEIAQRTERSERSVYLDDVLRRRTYRPRIGRK